MKNGFVESLGNGIDNKEGKMLQFVKRMITEREDLEGKIKRLRAALENRDLHLGKEQVDLINQQLEHMSGYNDTLCKRIALESKA